MTVKHATFTLERTYPTSPDRVFAAWADPAAKARWYVGATGEHELDFRVGGREVNRGRHADGPLLTFESHYQDIVAASRIVYTSTMSADGTLTTVSITTVEFAEEAGGTRLILAQQGTFLDGHEDPAWREQGTGDQLDALGRELAAAHA
ncbi:MAG TPA: SRPBCC family protein [Pseudonocardiaceae bacterium]|jgi:uncharacterized protein YndB with AHSA1/START domain|nr:SRPBCC family protein [Pseudonocardiaceae bacterium]